MDAVKPKRSLVEETYNILVDAICTGELASGERLHQDEIAARLNVSLFTVLRGMAMPFYKALDILETCDNPLLLRRARSDPLGLNLNAKFGQECIIIVCEISHLQLQLSCGQGMQRLQPYAFPRRPSR